MTKGNITYRRAQILQTLYISMSYPDLLFLKTYSSSSFLNPDYREETLNCRIPDTWAIVCSNVHSIMMYQLEVEASDLSKCISD